MLDVAGGGPAQERSSAARACARARRWVRSSGVQQSKVREVLFFAKRSMPSSREAIMRGQSKN